MIYAFGPYQQTKIAPFSSILIPALPEGVTGGINMGSLIHPDVGFFCAPDNVILDSAYREIGRGDIRDFVPQESERAIVTSIVGAEPLGDKLIDWIDSILTVNADPTGETAPRPLMPTTQLLQEISLNRQGIVSRKKFKPDSPEAANVIKLLKLEYAEIRRETLEGKRSKDNLPDLQYHRKWLDYQGEKLRIDKPEELLIPQGLPKETRIKHATILTDNFNRANANPVDNSAEGWSWTQVLNTIYIYSNIAMNYTGGYVECRMRAESDVSSSDHYVQAVFGQITAGSTVSGVLARYASGSNIAYYGWWNTFANLLQCIVGTDATVPVTGDIIKLQCSGSSIKLFLNGVQKISGTDSSIPGNTRGGITLLGANADNSSMDSYVIEDLPPATAASLCPPGLNSIRSLLGR